VSGPAALFFDFDGTLHDLEAASRAALRSAMPGLGSEALSEVHRLSNLRWAELWPAYLRGDLDEAALYEAWHGEVLRAAGGMADAAAVAALAERYAAALDRHMRPFPEVVPTLTALRASRPDVRLAVLTNGTALNQRRRIAALGLADLIPACIISGEVGAAKPQAAIFTLALAAVGVPPERAVMIGDAPQADVAGARRAGLAAVWLNRAGQPWPADVAPAPNAVAGDLGEAVRLAMASGS